MAIAFKQITVNFDFTSGIRQVQPFIADFNRKVLTAEAALKGFRIGFKDDDHEFFIQEIDIDILKIKDDVVEGRVEFLLQDDTGLGNDFGGYVQLIVIANLQ
ncbi:MAG: hypothetical protein HC877_15300 [Thioploca sp.]|nr:hypothetical protein [Thioploca sp.]